MNKETVFLLQHEYELDGYDTLKVLGIYSSQSLAEKAKARFLPEEGFRDHPEGFIIQECQIDKDLRSGGFITYRFPLED